MNLKILLPYDTETSGKVLFELPSEHPEQPHMVQVACHLVDSESREVKATFNKLVKPDGWVIPQEAIDVHGITNERAQDEGLPEKQVLEEFLDLWMSLAHDETRVAHNESFDARIIRIAICRFLTKEWADIHWDKGNAFCTMQAARDIMRLTYPSGRRGYKPPRLGEAVLYFTGKPLEGAHDALNDVNGCLDVYWGILKHRAETAGG